MRIVQPHAAKAGLIGHLKLGLDSGVIRLDQEPDAAFRGGEVSIRVELVNGTLLVARPKEATLNVPASPVMAAIPNFAARANMEINKLIDAERDKDLALFPDAPPNLTLPLFLGGINRNLDPETACSCGGAGNIGDVTSTLDGKSSIALAFSADIVKRFILCRAILNKDERDKNEADPSFGEPSETEREKLPTPCGDGELSRGSVTITRLDFTFRDGFIDIDGDFQGEDDCWEIDGGTFSQRLFMDFEPAIGNAPARFIPRLEPDVPRLRYHLNIEWYCILGVEVLTLLQIAVSPIAAFVGGTFTDFMVKALASSSPKPGQTVPAQTATTFGGIAWTGVAISTEGMVLLGNRIGGVVSQVRQPSVHIRTQHEPQNLVATGSGPVTVQAPTCAAEVFNYVQWVQDDRYTLTVASEWLIEPIE